MNRENNDIRKKLGEICDVFELGDKYEGYDLITNGNINSTYLVYLIKNGKPRSYVMQKINTYVFKNPDRIMSNIDKITTYIRNSGLGQSLHFHHVVKGRYKGLNYYREENNSDSFWRVSDYIDSVTFDTCDDIDKLHLAGIAFGKFQTSLSNFDVGSLYETIPDFHNTKKRIDTLLKNVEVDPLGRASSVAREVDFVREVRSCAVYLTEAVSLGKLPLRVSHNDTKINNVLFDKVTGEPIAVIDLDTVMPGTAMYDFGDAVRSAASSCSEDETELSRVKLDLGKYEAFAKGFISETAASLTREELKAMALGAVSITVELGVRFLDDYIIGDKYFKINRPLHNLDRARCQFALASDMLRKYEDMNSIVMEITKDGSVSDFNDCIFSAKRLLA